MSLSVKRATSRCCSSRFKTDSPLRSPQSTFYPESGIPAANTFLGTTGMRASPAIHQTRFDKTSTTFWERFAKAGEYYCYYIERGTKDKQSENMMPSNNGARSTTTPHVDVFVQTNSAVVALRISIQLTHYTIPSHEKRMTSDRPPTLPPATKRQPRPDYRIRCTTYWLL